MVISACNRSPEYASNYEGWKEEGVRKMKGVGRRGSKKREGEGGQRRVGKRTRRGSQGGEGTGEKEGWGGGVRGRRYLGVWRKRMWDKTEDRVNRGGGGGGVRV